MKTKIRKFFLQNPNNSLEEISKIFNVPKSTIQGYLINKDDLSIVSSLNEANTYFLFNNTTERVIHTKKDGVTIKNTQHFTHNEKIYLKRFGFVTEF